MDSVEQLTDDPDRREAVLHVERNGLQRRSGVSGYRCDLCGDAIPEDRRQAEPGTEHCWDCIETLNYLMNEACDDI